MGSGSVSGPQERVCAGRKSQRKNFTRYGRIVCEVYEAELDEEVDSDQELRGQTTFLGLFCLFEEVRWW